MNKNEHTIDVSSMSLISVIQIGIFILYFMNIDPVCTWSWQLLWLPTIAWVIFCLIGISIGVVFGILLLILSNIIKR